MKPQEKLNPSINEVWRALESDEVQPCGLSKRSTAQEIANVLEGLTLWGIVRGLVEDFQGPEDLLSEIEWLIRHAKEVAPVTSLDALEKNPEVLP